MQPQQVHPCSTEHVLIVQEEATMILTPLQSVLNVLKDKQQQRKEAPADLIVKVVIVISNLTDYYFLPFRRMY